jgi:hypothetical protein
METRLVLKRLREFALCELKEKCADRVVVRRGKLESLLRRGWLPQLRVRGIKGVDYLTCVFRGDSIRVYFMDTSGVSLGADEFVGDKKAEVWGEIVKRTKSVLSFGQYG